MTGKEAKLQAIRAVLEWDGTRDHELAALLAFGLHSHAWDAGTGAIKDYGSKPRRAGDDEWGRLDFINAIKEEEEGFNVKSMSNLQPPAHPYC